MKRLARLGQDKQIKFIFWTGGYDSTFRLLQLLLIEKKKICPVYISDPTTDTRKNSKYEIRQMRQIIQKINNRYPDIGQELLLPLVIIRKVPFRSARLERTFRQLNKNYREFYMRTFNGKIYYGQMEKMSIVSKRLKRPMDLGVIRNERDNEVYRNEHLARYKSDQCRFSYKMKYLWRAFAWLRFPIAHLTKEEMLYIAHVNGFSDILVSDTITCRWPKRNGNLPCSNCHMCKVRRKCLRNSLGLVNKHFQNSLIIPNKKPVLEKYKRIQQKRKLYPQEQQALAARLERIDQITNKHSLISQIRKQDSVEELTKLVKDQLLQFNKAKMKKRKNTKKNSPTTRKATKSASNGTTSKINILYFKEQPKGKRKSKI